MSVASPRATPGQQGPRASSNAGLLSWIGRVSHLASTRSGVSAAMWVAVAACLLVSAIRAKRVFRLILTETRRA
jgi:hypothetical protein